MSGLFDGIHNGIRLKYLQECFPKLGEYDWETLVKLISILNDIYLDGGFSRNSSGGLGAKVNVGPISHKIYEGYCFLYSKNLETQFGSGVFNSMVADLGCLDVKHEYEKGAFTKGYRLTKEWRKAFDDLYGATEDILIPYNKIIDAKGKPLRKPSNNNAIRSRCNNRNKAKTAAFIPFSIPVNQDCLRETFDYVKQLQGAIAKNRLSLSVQQRSRLQKMYNSIWDLYKASYSSPASRGELPQIYVEYVSGRLYGRGISLQRCMREVKYAALAGFQLKELDISNCHYVILQQLAGRWGIICPGIGYYISNKEDVRTTLTNDIYKTEIQQGLITFNEAQKIIKECLIAPVNGALTKGFKSRWWEFTDGDYETPKIVRALSCEGQFNGLEKAIMLEHHELFRFITCDIDEAVSVIIKSAKPVRSRGGILVYRNEMGKCINPEEKTTAQIISHFIRGVEAKILNIVLEQYSGQIYVPMHDGFTAIEGLDPREVERVIKEKSGFRVKLKQEVNYRNINVKIVKELIVQRCLQ